MGGGDGMMRERKEEAEENEKGDKENRVLLPLHSTFPTFCMIGHTLIVFSF